MEEEAVAAGSGVKEAAGKPSGDRPGMENLTPGLKPGQERDEKGRIKKAKELPPSPGPVDVLAEMEAVLTRAPKDDGTPYQKSLREFYKKDFKGFMAQLVQLRTKQKAEKAQPGAEEEVDEGTEAALAVLDRVLKECAES